MMAEPVTDKRRKRLEWRVRRGTRELDAMLGTWLEESYDSATSELQAAFDALLDEQDPDLWDWLMGLAPPPRADWQAIVDAIRARHRL